MARTLQEQLDAVDTLIQMVEAGVQEYTVNGRTVKLPALSTLYQQRSSLTGRVATTAGKSVARCRFPGPGGF